MRMRLFVKRLGCGLTLPVIRKKAAPPPPEDDFSDLPPLPEYKPKKPLHNPSEEAFYGRGAENTPPETPQPSGKPAKRGRQGVSEGKTPVNAPEGEQREGAPVLPPQTGKDENRYTNVSAMGAHGGLREMDEAQLDSEINRLFDLLYTRSVPGRPGPNAEQFKKAQREVKTLRAERERRQREANDRIAAERYGGSVGQRLLWHETNTQRLVRSVSQEGVVRQMEAAIGQPPNNSGIVDPEWNGAIRLIWDGVDAERFEEAVDQAYLDANGIRIEPFRNSAGVRVYIPPVEPLDLSKLSGQQQEDVRNLARAASEATDYQEYDFLLTTLIPEYLEEHGVTLDNYSLYLLRSAAPQALSLFLGAFRFPQQPP